MTFDWGSFLAGLSVGVLAEAAIGIFITAPMAVWILRRKMPELIASVVNDAKLMDVLRRRFVNATLGGMFGGRPPKLSSMAKMAAAKIGMGIIAKVGARFQAGPVSVDVQSTPQTQPTWEQLQGVPDDAQQGSETVPVTPSGWLALRGRK